MCLILAILQVNMKNQANKLELDVVTLIKNLKNK